MKLLVALSLGCLITAVPSYSQDALEGASAAKHGAPRIAWDALLPGTSITQIIIDGEGGVVVVVEEVVVWFDGSGRIRFQASGSDLRSVSPKGISYIDHSAVLWAVDRQGRQVLVPDSAGVLPIYPGNEPASPNQVSDKDGFFVYYINNDSYFLRRYEW